MPGKTPCNCTRMSRDVEGYVIGSDVVCVATGTYFNWICQGKIISCLGKYIYLLEGCLKLTKWLRDLQGTVGDKSSGSVGLRSRLHVVVVYV
jgi:hypothetical protein